MNIETITSPAINPAVARPNEKMSGQIFFWAITSALAGFLFGFDTVVISGAEQHIQTLWDLSPGMHGFAIASALYGTVLGSLFGGLPTDYLGRKKTLLSIGVLYVISAVGCAFANGVGMFIAARVIGGIGIGVSTVAAPLIHLGNRAAGLSRTARGNVSVQHCFWHSHCARIELDAGRYQ